MIRRLRASSVFYFVLALSLSGCRPASSSKPLYAIGEYGAGFFNQYSILRTIEENRGAFEVEISYKLENPPTAIEKIRFENLFLNSVNRWNSALYTTTDGQAWPWSELRVDFSYSELSDNCQFVAQYWQCQPSSVLRIIVDENTFRGYANLSQRLIVLGRFNFYRLRLEKNENGGYDWVKNGLNEDLDLILAHEFGHIVGLGDTYSELNYQSPSNSPQSIMNVLYSVDDLTKDDIDGIRALWDFMNDKGEYCSAGYIPETVEFNQANNVFCIPSNQKLKPSQQAYPLKSCQDFNGGYGDIFKCLAGNLCRKTNQNWNKNNEPEFWCKWEL